MARAKVILADADVIAHFIATGHIMELNGILSPHQLYVVENVYREEHVIPAMPTVSRKWMSGLRIQRLV